jgi:hypothetical protein
MAWEGGVEVRRVREEKRCEEKRGRGQRDKRWVSR